MTDTPDSFQYYWDRLLDHMTREEFYPEITKARKEYMFKTGEIFEDNPTYETKMRSFMDYYLFDRVFTPQPNVKKESPVEHFLNSIKYDTPKVEKDVYATFNQFIHSIFQVKKYSNESLALKDLYEEKTYHCTNVKETFSKGQIIEARIIPFLNGYSTTGAYLFHPEGALKLIKKAFVLVRKRKGWDQLSLIHKLAYCHARSEQYQHIDSITIYSKELFG